MVALGGVVVDDVEDHLDVRLVERLDHELELLDLFAVLAPRAVFAVGSEVADGVVPPVVAQALVHEVAVVDELVHGQQLERGDAEVLQVVDHGRGRQAGVGAAELLGDARVQLRQALHVRLVHHRVVPPAVGPALGGPVEEGVDHDRLRHEGSAVGLLHDVIAAADGVGEDRRVPVDLAVDCLGVRIEQELVRVAPVPLGGVVGTVHAVPVPLPGTNVQQVAVPPGPGLLRKRDPRLLAVLIEQAEVDALRHVGEDREVGAGTVEGGPQREGLAGPDGHRSHVAVFPCTSVRRNAPSFPFGTPQARCLTLRYPGGPPA